MSLSEEALSNALTPRIDEIDNQADNEAEDEWTYSSMAKTFMLTLLSNIQSEHNGRDYTKCQLCHDDTTVPHDIKMKEMTMKQAVSTT